MSGPTGIKGPQGPGGFKGSDGSMGSAGPYGPQGPRGQLGPTGLTGLPGSTGTQLYGNGSLAQTLLTTLPLEYTPGTGIPFHDFNPALAAADSSATISGQYDLLGLNYYGSPMTFDAETRSKITFPVGKYYITAIAPIYTNAMLTDPVYLTLSAWDDEIGYTDIAYSTPAFTGDVCHLQTIYTPTADTVVSLFLNQTESGFYSVGNGNTVTLSIVKFW